jgi:hypothetical protein
MIGQTPIAPSQAVVAKRTDDEDHPTVALRLPHVLPTAAAPSQKLKVTVGTVKKSSASITSRWFSRNVNQLLNGNCLDNVRC